MDIDARIERRQRRTGSHRLVRDRESLSPAAHVDEPVGRGPLLERVLDHLDPAFDRDLPANGYLRGPFGAGKSAVVTALFARLDARSTSGESVIHTSTRAATPASPGFVYVDARETTSAFAFYRAVLDGLRDESVPEHGVGTDDLRERLRGRLDEGRGAVVAVDHAGEPDALDAGDLLDLFAGLAGARWLAVGRTPPDRTALTDHAATVIEVEPYRRGELVDVVMARASAGLARGALDHALARRIAERADGNAHHALAALFVAADRAGRDRVTGSDVAAALDEMPESPVSLARVLALPANKQAVLRGLVDLDSDDRVSVATATEAIAATGLDLSPGTIKRYLYELAGAGVLERVRAENPERRGRPPSRVELRFPPSAFRRLYDRGG
jgi:Cdc6-like AAA superfamily ATPase